MAWHRPGDKPPSEPMMVSLLRNISVTRPQWIHCPRQFNNSARCLAGNLRYHRSGTISIDQVTETHMNDRAHREFIDMCPIPKRALSGYPTESQGHGDKSQYGDEETHPN